MVKSCAVKLILEKSIIKDPVTDIEFVKIKGDPNPKREWEVISYQKSGKNVYIRVDANSKENLDWIKSHEVNFNTKEEEMKSKKPFPRAVDWFVVDHLPEVTKLYGRRPTQLEIMCPSNDIETVLPGLYKNNRGDIINCVGDGQTARRMDGDGIWNEIPYCNCGYRQGLPAKTVLAKDIKFRSGDYCILKTDDPLEKDVWRQIQSETPNGIRLHELEPTCGPKVEIRFLLYKTNKSILHPYVIRTRHLKTYDYIKNTLVLIKNGNENTEGLNRLMNVPLVLNIRVEKSYVMENNRKIPKDDIVVTVDFDLSYGNPIEKMLGQATNVAKELPPASKPAELKQDNNIEEAEYTTVNENTDPKKIL